MLYQTFIKSCSRCIKFMCKHIETCNSKSHYLLGLKLFCQAQNYQLVTDAIKKFNVKKKLSIAYHEIITLFANIPHNELKNVMR